MDSPIANQESPLLTEDMGTDFEDQRERRSEPADVATRNAWNTRLNQIQTVSLLMAHFLSLMAIVVVINWIGLLGGLSWKHGESKSIFNWHPLLMITGFAFMTVASLSFRYRHSSRSYLKLTHAISWAVAALCGFVALLAVFRSHNDPVGGFVANLYSLHSWIGCLVIALYVVQFTVGTISFAWPLSNMTPVLKARILAFHRLFGPFIYNATALTILLGIQEKEGFVGCAYSVSKADTFPIDHFWEIPVACRVSHLLGVLVISISLCTNLACHNFVGPSRRNL